MSEPEDWTVLTFAARWPVAQALADDMGSEDLEGLAIAEATDRLTAAMAGRRFKVVRATARRVDLLPGHTLGGWDPDTGEPLGPPGFMLATDLRVASPDWTPEELGEVDE